MSWSHSHAPAIALAEYEKNYMPQSPWARRERTLLSSSFTHKEHLKWGALDLILNFSASPSHCLLTCPTPRPFFLQLLHLTSLFSLLTCLSQHLSPSLLASFSLEPPMSVYLSCCLSLLPFPCFSLSFLSASSHNRNRGFDGVDATVAELGSWSSSCGLFNLSHSVFCLFLKSAKIWKQKKWKKEISLFFPVNWRQTFGLHYLAPSSRTPFIIVCLPRLMSVSPSQHPLSHQTHNCSPFTSGFICFIQLFPDCFHRLFLSSPFLFLPSVASHPSYSFGPLFLFRV